MGIKRTSGLPSEDICWKWRLYTVVVGMVGACIPPLPLRPFSDKAIKLCLDLAGPPLRGWAKGALEAKKIGQPFEGEPMIKRVTLITAGVLIATQASAATFDQYVGFGDSTLDSGWWGGALSGQCGYVSGSCTTGNTTKDAKISAAITNGGTGTPVGVGLMSSQILASDFGLSAIPANQPNGTNYAISGSLSARAGGMGNVNPNTNLPSTVEQISAYLGSNFNAADPNALYEISSGGNDRTYSKTAFGNLADQETFLANQATALATAISDLQAAGAKTILVRGAAGTSTLETFWDNALFTDLTNMSVNYIKVDMSDLVETVENNPTLYGFTAETVMPGVPGSSTGSACVAGLGASGWGQWCADKTTPNPDYSHLRATDSEQTSFFRR
jgi:outer membrane lipase/esterase